MIIGDFNAKIRKIIKGNNPETNKSGKYLTKIARRHEIKIINSTEKCEEKWTKINTQNEKEKAIIDYILCSDKLYDCTKKMKIDEEKQYRFTKYIYNQQSVKIKETDHNTITIEFDLNS